MYQTIHQKLMGEIGHEFDRLEDLDSKRPLPSQSLCGSLDHDHNFEAIENLSTQQPLPSQSLCGSLDHGVEPMQVEVVERCQQQPLPSISLGEYGAEPMQVEVLEQCQQLPLPSINLGKDTDLEPLEVSVAIPATPPAPAVSWSAEGMASMLPVQGLPRPTQSCNVLLYETAQGGGAVEAVPMARCDRGMLLPSVTGSICFVSPTCPREVTSGPSRSLWSPAGGLFTRPTGRQTLGERRGQPTPHASALRNFFSGDTRTRTALC